MIFIYLHAKSIFQYYTNLEIGDIIMAKCSYCGKSLNFFNKYVCACCGKVMCGGCLVKVPYSSGINELLVSADNGYTKPRRKLLGGRYLCKECSAQYKHKYDTMVDAVEDHLEVKLVSGNYLGNRFDRLKKVKCLKTSYYRNKSDAENDIKSMAKYLGCTHVLELSFDRREDEEKGPKGGTHIYSTWSAIGIAAKYDSKK